MSDSDLTLQNSLIRAPAITTQSLSHGLLPKPGFRGSLCRTHGWSGGCPITHYLPDTLWVITFSFRTMWQNSWKRSSYEFHCWWRRKTDDNLIRAAAERLAAKLTTGQAASAQCNTNHYANVLWRCGTCHGWRVGTRGEFCLGR